MQPSDLSTSPVPASRKEEFGTKESNTQDIASLSNRQLRRRIIEAGNRRDNYRVAGCATYIFFYLALIFVSSLCTELIFTFKISFIDFKNFSFMVTPLVVGMASILIGPITRWRNERFYRRMFHGKAGIEFTETLRELAHRGDRQAFGPLLELMDARSQYAISSWGVHGALFIETLTALLPHVTPESFSTLYEEQIQQILPLLLAKHDENQRTALIAMLARCGDFRLLRRWRLCDGEYIKSLEERYSLRIGHTMPTKYDMIALAPSTLVLVRPAIAEIARRMGEDNINAQLLRPSAASDIPLEAAQLLRGAMPDETNSVPVNQLLRPIHAETSTQTPAYQTQNRDDSSTTVPLSQYNTMAPNETITLRQQSGD